MVYGTPRMVTNLLIALMAPSMARASLSSTSTIHSSSNAISLASLQPEEGSSPLLLPLIPHHKQRQRRNLLEETPSTLRRREKAQQVGALFQGYGTHYVDLWVGTPPQRQTVIVDTGSGVTAFPCSSCHDCGDEHHIDQYFQEKKSETFHKFNCDECRRGHCSNGQQCRIGMSYQEGSSWQAYECSDQTYLGGLHYKPLLKDDGGTEDMDPFHAPGFKFPLVFGCQDKITGLFKTQLADGIMGMDNADTAFWMQIFNSNTIASKSFALCFSRQPTADRDGTEAGALTLGGVDERFHSSKMVHTQSSDKNRGFFNLHLRKVYLRAGGGGDSALSSDPNIKYVTVSEDESILNRGKVIVDSGTTDSYFTRSLSGPFKNAYKELTGKDYGHGSMSLNAEQLDALPTILIQIMGDEELNKKNHPNPETVPGLAASVDPDHPYDVILAIPPSHYMEYDRKSKKYIARFYVDEGSGSVIGANAMMGHNVLFDIDNARVGWAESPCDYTKVLHQAGYDITAEKPENWTPEDTETNKKEVEPKGSSQEDHDSDKPDDDIKKKPYMEAVSACSDLTCRGSVAAALLGVLLVGIVAGRVISRRGNSAARYQQATELVTMAGEDEEEFAPRYRDHPEGDVADAGVGYEDEEAEGDAREIA